MGPIGIRHFARRHRQHLAGIVVAFVIASGLALHHSDLGMAAGHHQDQSAVAGMCLGASTAVGAVAAAAAIAALSLRRPRFCLTNSLCHPSVVRLNPRAAIRAGPPPPLIRLCVQRL